MDGAFFLTEIIELLDQPGIDYAIKVPFWQRLELQSGNAWSSIASVYSMKPATTC